MLHGALEAEEFIAGETSGLYLARTSWSIAFGST